MSYEQESQSDNFQVGVKLRTFNYTLDKALRAGQEKAGLTRAVFCPTKLGISYHTIGRYLSFKAYPSEKNILAIAIALEVPPDDIFPPAISNIRLEKQPDAIPVPLEQAVALGFGGEVPALDSAEALNELELPAVVESLLIHTLNAKEQQVLILRFGLSGEQEHGSSEIATIMGLTRGRINQIEQRAMRKLRSPSKIKQLGEYAPAPECQECYSSTELDQTWDGYYYCPRHLKLVEAEAERERLKRVSKRLVAEGRLLPGSILLEYR